ncbi:MAG: winged helix-turn-helix transcriptional regulator [Treponema sp.]|nr:winged helix-turn-helix transcriptional regulator [Treponema sp.]
MNSDVATLQCIAKTLEAEPLASQRVLAENAGMSIGLMNAVLKRFVERGWIMLTNVNLRKLSYAVTAEGIAELTARSQNFARRTFSIANNYNDALCSLFQKAKAQGKKNVILYGQSYIKFMLEYACSVNGFSLLEKKIDDPVDAAFLCVAGELCEEGEMKRLVERGCINLLTLLDQ